MHLSFSLVDDAFGKPDVSYRRGVYKLKYPCVNSWNCTPYKTRLPKGIYQIELYGASGGSNMPTPPLRYSDNSFLPEDIVSFYHGNVVASKGSSLGGSGGYTSGILTIPKETDFYIRIGGEGQDKSSGIGANSPESEKDEYRPQGGYNGGGKATAHGGKTGGGGGATDIRAEKDTVFHRVMVAGAGGGSDNYETGAIGFVDDGSGGAGGGLTTQGYFVEGKLNSTFIAGQLNGFSFGQGESARWGESKHPKGSKANYGSSDRAGAGGGWFGGFASQHGNAGSGGGSSFALTFDAQFPKETLHVYDDLYNDIGTGSYAFQNHEYTVLNAVFVAGIWYGNGFATIKPLSKTMKQTCNHIKGNALTFLFFVTFIELK